MKSLPFNRCFRIFTAVCIIISISSCSGNKERKAPPPTVVVAPIKAEKIAPSMDFVGQAVSMQRVDLIARVQGFLVKKGFQDGDYVKNGQLLFQIEQDQYRADVKAAKAVLLQAEAILKNAEIEFNRNNTLVQKSAVARTDFDKASMNKDKGVADMLAAKAKLETAELNLSYTDIYAPFDGKIGLAKYDVGNLVGPTSSPLATVIMLDPIKIEFSISESLLVTALQDKETDGKSGPSNINKILQSKNYVPTIILSNGTEYKYPGEIYFVDNKINQLTGSITLRAYFPNPDHLIIPGAYVKVKMTSHSAKNVLLVPQKAMQENQSGKYVYIVDKDKKTEQRSIKTFGEYGQYLLTLDGVKEGESIIIQGLQKVRPGMEVNPISESEAEAQKQKVK